MPRRIERDEWARVAAKHRFARLESAIAYFKELQARQRETGTIVSQYAGDRLDALGIATNCGQGANCGDLSSPEQAFICARSLLSNLLLTLEMSPSVPNVLASMLWTDPSSKIHMFPVPQREDTPANEFDAGVLVHVTGVGFKKVTSQCYETRKFRVEPLTLKAEKCIAAYKLACDALSSSFGSGISLQGTLFDLAVSSTSDGLSYESPSEHSLSGMTACDGFCHPLNVDPGSPKACPSVESVKDAARAAYCASGVMTYTVWEGEGSADRAPAWTVYQIGKSHFFSGSRCLKYLAEFIAGQMDLDAWKINTRIYVAPLPLADHGVEVQLGDVVDLGAGQVTGTEILHSAQLAGFMSAVWASFRWNRYTSICMGTENGCQPWPEHDPTMGTICKGGGPTYKHAWHSTMVPVFFGRDVSRPFWTEVLAKYGKLVRMMSTLPWPASIPLQEWLLDPRNFPMVLFGYHGPSPEWISGDWDYLPKCIELMTELHWK